MPCTHASTGKCNAHARTHVRALRVTCPPAATWELGLVHESDSSRLLLGRPHGHLGASRRSAVREGRRCVLRLSQERRGGVDIAGEREGQGGAGASEGAQGEKLGYERGEGWGGGGVGEGQERVWARGGEAEGRGGRGDILSGREGRRRSSGRRGSTLKRSSNVLSSASRESNEEWNACARGDRRRAVSIGRARSSGPARSGCTHDGMAAAGA